MKQMFLLIFGLVAFFASFWATSSFAAGLDGNSDVIKSVSITVGNGNQTTDPIPAIQNLGFKILGLAKMIVSGLALIYLVMIGVYMVVFSENEDRIKTQKRQIFYSLVGFLFLNIP